MQTGQCAAMLTQPSFFNKGQCVLKLTLNLFWRNSQCVLKLYQCKNHTKYADSFHYMGNGHCVLRLS